MIWRHLVMAACSKSLLPRSGQQPKVLTLGAFDFRLQYFKTWESVDINWCSTEPFLMPHLMEYGCVLADMRTMKSLGFVFQGKGNMEQNCCSLKESYRGYGALRRGKESGPVCILTLSSALCTKVLSHLTSADIKLEWLQHIFQHLIGLEGSLTQSAEYPTMSN